jgi:peptidoglycan/LPS O-acetylase OafA/YrhL
MLFITACTLGILFSTLWVHVPAQEGILYFVKTFAGLGSYFFTGMMFYLFRSSIVLDRKWQILALFLLFLTFYIQIPECFLLIPAAYLIFSFAYSSSIQLYDVAKIGDLSYGVYIYAWPIQQIMEQVLGKQANWFTIFCASLPFVVGLAFLSWHFVEKKSLQLKVHHVKQTS